MLRLPIDRINRSAVSAGVARFFAKLAPARLLARAKAIPTPLALLLLAAAALSIGWNIAVAPLQGPDEGSHFAYVQQLAETGQIPSVAGTAPSSTEEQEVLTTLNLQALIGNLGGRPAWSAPDLQLWHATERSMPRGSRANGTGGNALAKNPPLYYAAMTIPYRLFVWLPLLKRLFVLRLFNALCYLATIVLVWLLAGDVFGGARWKQVLAAGVVTLHPQLQFMSAVINADNLLITLTTAFLLVALRLVRDGPTTARVLGVTLLSAAAALTHGRGLVTVPVLLVALAVSFYVHRPLVREALQRAVAALVTLGVAAGAYLAFGRARGSTSAYGGDVTALNSHYFNLRQFISSVYQFYFPKLPSLRPRIGPEYGYRQVFINTFYGTFGSLEVLFPVRVYDALQVTSALGLVGFYTATVARIRRVLRAWPAVLVMLTTVLTTLVFLHYVSYRALLNNGGVDPLIVGRYLLPIISLFALAITFTIGSLPRRVGPCLAAIVLAAGVLLSLMAVGITMVRFYA